MANKKSNGKKEDAIRKFEDIGLKSVGLRSSGSGKKVLTREEEFDIMKLVLDKFLWLGFGIMGLGLYNLFTNSLGIGFTWIIVGAIVLILFMLIIVREYEIIA